MSTQPFDPSRVAPDPTLERRRAANAYLERVWPAERQHCPICNTTEWGINNVAILPVRAGTDPTSGVVDSNHVYPLVPVVCRTCGYTFFINEKWVLAGGTPPNLMPDPAPEQ
jgi:predicted nucleic-acid-binding Zn-ribbon protein